MKMKCIRQTADVAANVLEKLGNSVHPVVRQAISAHFVLEEQDNGELGIEFLQGFYSGLFFAQDWLIKTSGASPATNLVTDLTIEAARQYIKRIEKELHKKC